MSNFLLEYVVCREPDGIQKTFTFQIFVYLWFCKCCVAAGIFPDIFIFIPFHYRRQKFLPAISDVDFTGAKQHSFTVAELIEAEQRMEAIAAEMTVICPAFLLAVYRAF